MTTEEIEQDIRRFFANQKMKSLTTDDCLLRRLYSAMRECLLVSQETVEKMFDTFVETELLVYLIVYRHWEYGDDVMRERWIDALPGRPVFGIMCRKSYWRWLEQNDPAYRHLTAAEKSAAAKQYKAARGIVDPPTGYGRKTKAAARNPENESRTAENNVPAPVPVNVPVNVPAPVNVPINVPVPVPVPVPIPHHPHGPHEWSDSSGSARFFADADGRTVRLPDEAPDRPSATARWNPIAGQSISRKPAQNSVWAFRNIWLRRCCIFAANM